MTQELRAMHSIRDRILTDIGDKARVQTDKEAEATITEIDTVTATEGMIKIEGTVQTGAIEVQTDSQDRRLEKIPDSLDQSQETEIESKTDREVQLVIDSKAVVEMLEMIRTEVVAMTGVRTEAMIADRVD